MAPTPAPPPPPGTAWLKTPRGGLAPASPEKSLQVVPECVRAQVVPPIHRLSLAPTQTQAPRSEDAWFLGTDVQTTHDRAAPSVQAKPRIGPPSARPEARGIDVSTKNVSSGSQRTASPHGATHAQRQAQIPAWQQLFAKRAKLYKFRGNDWSPIGVGNARLVMHEETGFVRFLFHEEETRSIIENHGLSDASRLSVLTDSQMSIEISPKDPRCIVWLTKEPGTERFMKFLLKLGSEDHANTFKCYADNANLWFPNPQHSGHPVFSEDDVDH